MSLSSGVGMRSGCPPGGRVSVWSSRSWSSWVSMRSGWRMGGRRLVGRSRRLLMNRRRDVVVDRRGRPVGGLFDRHRGAGTSLDRSQTGVGTPVVAAETVARAVRVADTRRPTG